MDSCDIYYGLKNYIKDKRLRPTLSALTLIMAHMIYIMMSEKKDDIPTEPLLDEMLNVIKDQIKLACKEGFLKNKPLDNIIKIQEEADVERTNNLTEQVKELKYIEDFIKRNISDRQEKVDGKQLSDLEAIEMVFTIRDLKILLSAIEMC